MSALNTWKCLGGAVAVLVGSLSGGAQAQTPATPAAAPAHTRPATVLSRADQRLLSEMAQANLAEIEAGKIAQAKAENAQVKAFAQKMVDDHGKALQAVQQVAQAKGVTLPTEPDKKHQRMTQRLGTLSGTEFDRRYMAQNGIADHKQTHQLLQRVQNRAVDPDVKALAATMQPTVQQHLNSVQQLSAALQGGATTSSGSSGTSGTSGKSDYSPAAPATPATPERPDSSGQIEQK